MKKSLLSILGITLICASPLAADEIAGFVRLDEMPGADNAPLDDEVRFTDITLDEHAPFRGTVLSAAGDVITVKGSFWKPSEFVYAGAEQPRHFYAEIVTGSAAGSRFDITANTGNTLTVGAGSLAGIAAEDEIRVVSMWSLNLLFPNGGELEASTAGSRGTEILFPTSGVGGVDYAGASVFRYRSDLGFWIDRDDAATDVGDMPISVGALLSIRQAPSAPLDLLFSGFKATSGSPLKLDVHFAEADSDNFSDATAITGSGMRVADTLGATGEVSETQHSGNGITASVWMKYTASANGTLTMSSETSDFDTILAAYSGTALANLQLIVANDDVPSQTWSEIEFSVESGEDYYIALDGKNGAGGTGNLDWVFVEDIPPVPEIVIEQPVNTDLTDGSATADFGSVEIGSNSQLTFTIRNTGTAELTGLAASVVGPQQSEYGPGTFGATTLQLGGSTTVTVTFSPADTGSRTATLSIISNDADENPFDIALTGIGTSPPAGLDPPTNVMATDGAHEGEVRVTWTASNGATQYQVFRGRLSDGSDAVLIGTTADLNFSDTEGNAEEDYYYFVKSTDGETTSAFSTGDTGTASVISIYQPDALVGKKSSSLKGNNIYNTGSGQKITQKSKNRKKLKWYFGIENDGNKSDDFPISLTGKNNYFRTKLRASNGANVTASATVGTLQASLASGEKTLYKFEVKPTSKSKEKSKSRTFSFRTRSTTAIEKYDIAKAKAKTKK